MQIKRRKSKIIKVGGIKIGGSNPVVVQSMAKTFTSDLQDTLRELRELSEAGCKIIRLAVKDKKDAMALRKIRRQTSLALVADIHFDKNLALQAIDNGVDKIRLNPGNIYKKEEIREIAQAAKLARIPIRIGVNSGSLPRYSSLDTRYSKEPARLMVKSALDYIRLLEGFKFRDIIISLKSSDIFTTIKANREISKLTDYPLHLGVTATGTSTKGIVKSAIAVGMLLFEGIGDTIRISLTDKSVQEVRAGYSILEAMGLSNPGLEVISCPTCGRCEVDLIKIVGDLEKKLAIRYSLAQRQAGLLAIRPIKLAVMGCVVNGPGEAEAADLGIAFGKHQGLFFKKGKAIRKVSSRNCVDTLLQELNKII